MNKYELYNRYISFGDTYNSKICFVNIGEQSVESVRLSYVRFKDEYIKNTGFYDVGFHDYNKKIKFIEDNNDLIEDVSQSVRYYTYVKVIEDYNNPSLNGKIMLFYFGRKIYDIMYDGRNKVYNRVFNLQVNKVGPYPSYDNCYFTDIRQSHSDNTLSLNNKSRLRKLDIIQFRRMLKLKKLNIMK